MNELTHAVASLQQLVEQQATKSSEQAHEFASQLAQLCSSVSAIEARLDSSQCPVETYPRRHASGKREHDLPLTQSYSKDMYTPAEHDFGPSFGVWADQEASECSPKAGPVSESNNVSQVPALPRFDVAVRPAAREEHSSSVRVVGSQLSAAQTG